MEPGCLYWCLVAGQRGSGHKLKHRRLLLNIRKDFFTVRVSEYWQKLPREVVAHPSLNISKNLTLDMVLSNWLSDDPV